MANYIIKTPRNINVQENDNSTIDIFPPVELPFSDAQFTFGVFTKSASLFIKNNADITRGTQVIESVTRNKLTINITPTNTLGHANKDLCWELQLKKANGEFLTIGQGKFIIKKTRITNV